MSITPFRFDDSDTERSRAATLLSIGIGQAQLVAMSVAARGDASHGLTGIGDSGAVSGNPMNLSGAPTNVAQSDYRTPAATATAPPGHFNPMQVNASGNYVQPNTANPRPLPAGQVSELNPMGC